MRRPILPILLSARLAACLAILLIAGCSGPYVSDMIRKPVLPDYPRPDTTYLLFDPSGGFRVEYYAMDGTARLWAPSAAMVISGVWRMESPFETVNLEVVEEAARKLCIRYGPRAAKVAEFGVNDWDCRPRIRVADEVVAGLTGDVFNLAPSGPAPYALDRCRPPGAFELLKPAGC